MNEFERNQASVELVSFIGGAIIDIGRGLKNTLEYGYRAPHITSEDAKQAIDAINNAAKVFAKNEDVINLCEQLSDLAKACFDFCDNQS